MSKFTTRPKLKPAGFTIIEVLIVLAIAGLIMLVVFLAVPALQRNLRNTQRTNDAALIAAAVNECLANKNNIAIACDDFDKVQIKKSGVNEGKQLIQNLTWIDVHAPDDDWMPRETTDHPHLHMGWKCTNEDGYINSADNDPQHRVKASARQFVIVYRLETPDGTNPYRCVDG